MEFRIPIIEQIPQVIKHFLNEYDPSNPIPPTRILGDTPNRIIDQSDFMASVNTIIEETKKAILTCRPDSEVRWLTMTKFGGRHSFFVLDLNNLEYDYESAHNCLTEIPVYILRLSKAPKIFRYQAQDRKLAEKLAELHNLHGKEPLPFFDDHTQRLVYASPRNLVPWSGLES